MSYLRYLLFFLLAQSVAASAFASISEDEEKVRYLMAFYSMGEWPQQRPQDVFNICTLGHGQMNNALKRWEFQNRNTHPNLRFPTPSTLRLLRECQIVFIGEREQPQNKAIIAEIGDAPVLTATDSPRIVDTMLTFAVEGNKLVFDVNLSRIDRAKLRFDPMLLNEARIAKTKN